MVDKENALLSKRNACTTWMESNIFALLLDSRKYHRKKAQQWLDDRDIGLSLEFFLKTISSSCEDNNIKRLAIVQLCRRLDQLRTREKGDDARSNFLFIHEHIAPQVIELYKKENDPDIQYHFIPIVGAIAALYSAQEQEWKALWIFIRTLFLEATQKLKTEQPHNDTLSTSLYLLTGLLQHSQHLEHLEKHLRDVMPFLHECLKVVNSWTSIKSLLQFLTAFAERAQENAWQYGDDEASLVECEKKETSTIINLLDEFISPVIQCVVNVFQTLLSSGDTIDQDVVDVIIILVCELFEQSPSLFSNCLQSIQQLTLLLVKHTNLNHGCKNVAVRLFFMSLEFLTLSKSLATPFLQPFGKHTVFDHVVQSIISVWEQLMEIDNLNFIDFNNLSELTYMHLQVCSSVTTGNLWEILVHHLCHFLTHCDCPALNLEIMKQLVETLLNKSSPVSTSIGSHFICVLVEEQPELIQPVLSQLLHYILNRLSDPEHMAGKENLWWLLKAQSALMTSFSTTIFSLIPLENILKPFLVILETYMDEFLVSESLKSLCIIFSFDHQNKLDLQKLTNVVPNIMKPFTSFDSSNQPNDVPSEFLRLVPFLIKFDSFSSEYDQQLIRCIRGLLNPKLVFSSTHGDNLMSFERSNASIDLSIKLFKKNPHSPDMIQHIRFVLEYVLDALEFFFLRLSKKSLCGMNVEYLNRQNEERVCLLMDNLFQMCCLMDEQFADYCSRFFTVVVLVLDLPHGTIFQSECFPESPLKPFPNNDEMTRRLSEKIKESFDQEKWSVTLRDDGVAQFVFKGDEEKEKKFHVFQLNYNVIKIKTKILECLNEVLFLLPNACCPFISKNISQILRAAVSGPSPLCKAAVGVLSCVLETFLPESHEANVAYQNSMCPLRRCGLSLSVWFSMTRSLVLPLIECCWSISSPQECVFYLNAIQNLCDSFQEGVTLQTRLISSGQASEALAACVENDTTEWIELLFQVYESVLVSTLSEHLNDTSEDEGKIDRLPRDSLKRPVHDEEEEGILDSEGCIYESVMLGVVSLLKVFSKKASALFFRYLNTAYMSLLTLPQVNVKGRVAALLAYSELIRYGTVKEMQDDFVEIFLLLCLLYVRPNKPRFQYSVDHEKFQNFTDILDEADDVERIYAASYGLSKICPLNLHGKDHRFSGVIARFVPDVFHNYIDASLKLLYANVLHSHCRSVSRQITTESCVSTLLEIYLNPVYEEACRSFLSSFFHREDHIMESFLELMTMWFPFIYDRKGSCRLIDALVEDILNETSCNVSTLQQWISTDTHGRHLAELVEKRLKITEHRYRYDSFWGINHQCWTEGNFHRALEKLGSLGV